MDKKRIRYRRVPERVLNQKKNPMEPRRDGFGVKQNYQGRFMRGTKDAEWW